MESRRLGRTGHESSVAILGGAAFWESSEEQARAGVALAVDRGVNHLDIAPQYGGAEVVVGPSVPAVRDRLFVAGKTLRANPEGVEAQFDETRARLGCDVLDLYQAHAVTSLDELDRRAAGIERILSLRDRGVTRFAGITGHDLEVATVFLEALRRYDLDTVMFPVYPRLWADPSYRESAEELLAVCRERDLGVMAIKAVARRPWSGERPSSPWYEPWTDPGAVGRGISFALATPGVHAFCTPGDPDLLATVLDAAEAWAPLDDGQRDAAVAAMAGEEVIFPIPA
ncbi:MAG: aldo/keto reductase [Acidimicrobiia bacterium]|nr:aldo/keto reductase [Acidimicrobiia bacterium]